ncbi:MAG TPA: FecR domain-containing protein [Methylomirabilota bacterium]|jgi:hypothetical protein
MRTIRRAIWLLLPLFVVGTSLAITASSEEMRAGVVAGVQGTAKVTRVSLPQPELLKFKDDVYLLDEVVTGDASMARILLGGKALLTVRERSMVKITEMPGVSTVAVMSGRAAVNVIKERMRAGDSVEIVTPNATAAIRGTIVVAEVEPDTTGPRSTITVLRGLIDVTQHDDTGRAFGQPVSVSALQQVIVTGGRMSPVQQITRPAAERMAGEFKMGLRAAPSTSAVQSEVDRAVQQINGNGGVSKDGGSGTTDKSADSSKGGDTKSSGDKTASGGGNSSGTTTGNGGGSGSGSGGSGGGTVLAGGGGGDSGGGNSGGSNSGGGNSGGNAGGGNAGGNVGGGNAGGGNGGGNVGSGNAGGGNAGGGNAGGGNAGGGGNGGGNGNKGGVSGGGAKKR